MRRRPLLSRNCAENGRPVLSGGESPSRPALTPALTKTAPRLRPRGEILADQALGPGPAAPASGGRGFSPGAGSGYAGPSRAEGAGLARIAPFRRALLRPALALALACGLAAPALPAAETLPEAAPDAAASGSGAAPDPAPVPETSGPPDPTVDQTAAPIPADPAAAPGPEPRPAALAEPEGVDPAVAARLFAEPEVAEQTRSALALLEAGDTAEAAALFDQMIARHPGMGLLHARRAAVALLLEDPDRARAEIRAAAAAGLPDLAGVLADPLFAPLAGDAELQALAARPEPEAELAPEPAPIRDGTALVSAANTAWDPEAERLRPRFAFPARPGGAVLGPGPKTAARDLLTEHVRRGRAAGNGGDLYDNRDRGHSRLSARDHPQVTATAYSAAAQAAEVDYGLADRILFDRPTFGNSSTAITAGPYWRSLPRQAMTEPDGAGPMRLWQTAAANATYVYPAHKDFGEEQGDLFPANTPYVLVSRGSSGSDQPFLEALAMILAALKPETKAKAAEAGMLNSTVQMVFRRSLQNVRSRESYFSADAHPAAFEAWQINLARMVSLAQSIRPGDLPAEARIRVVEEDLGTEGVDFFGAGLSERLFDTPQAVARIWRSTRGRRSMVLSAEDSRDANGRALKFEWRLLQGDPDKVTIEPLDGGGRARVTIDWHEPFPISKDNPVKSSRVDIGVFANNGVHDSAPAILSWAFPSQETRVYAPGPDGAPRIVSVDYADPAKAAVYADPLLYPRADWRDAYRYAADGTPLGWTRVRGGAETVFGPDGARAETGAGGLLRYPLAPRPDGTLAVEERALVDRP